VVRPMQLSKHHGLGNDFLVLLDECQPSTVAVDGALARAVCDRHRGIGADGLLHGRSPGADDGDVDVVMRLHNADGGIAEMSGNGIRCFAQAVADTRGLGAGTLRIATDAGLRVVELGERDGAEVQVRVEMGVARPGPDVPEAVAERLGAARFGTRDLGNPHLVVLVPDATAVDPAVDGPWLEQQFPDGVNVEFISPAEGTDGEATIDLRVWERGVGVTEACGTGACAATALAVEWGLATDRARVAMPGGAATVELGSDGTVVLTGPSVRIATITWEAS